MPFFIWLHQFSLFKIELSALSLFAGFILQDFLYYWFHRASHNIHWFWLAHVVHHSSTKMNFTTAFRQSVLYPFVGMWLFWVPMILIGFRQVWSLPLSLSIWLISFVHTQQLEPRLGRAYLQHAYASPIHHATNKTYIDKITVAALICWDRV